MQPPRSRQGRRRASSHRRAAAPAPHPPMPPAGPAGQGGRGGRGGRRGGGPRRPVSGDWLGDDLEREFEGARRTRLRGVIVGVTALVLVAVAGLGAMAYLSFGGGTKHAAVPPPARETGTGQDGGARVETEPSDAPLVKPTRSLYIPTKGTGKFLLPASGSRVFGHGKVMRYMVQVEGGLRQDPTKFARSVDKILADKRGWTASGKWAFQRVNSGQYDFVVQLASPKTVDRICGSYGMTTNGTVNCSGGKQVVVNLRRWLLLTKYYRGQPDAYHALTINHEVGHRLGFGHMTCPGRGRLAPVMMQQIYGLKGCRANPWPFDAHGRFLTGPAVAGK
ncbi:MAG TPA: DUF3152 domain-containing protein [Spirillospora sp.]|nr:DUF3152 domain-containing protein [Spirillospora sp.]